MTAAAVVPYVPLLIILATIGAVLVAGSRGAGGDDRVVTVVVAVVGVAAALAASVLIWWRGPQALGGLETDAFASFFDVAWCALGVFAVVMPELPTSRAPTERARRDVLILAALAAMMVAGAAQDLVVASLALLVTWLVTVLLTAIGRHRDVAMEAAFKALMAGAFIGALWLYGVALLYGVTGESRLTTLATRIAASSLDPSVLVLLAMALVVAGLCFIVAAVPFHFWAADSSSGADGDEAGFLTTGLRLAGCAVLMRVLLVAFAPLRVEWLPVLSAIAGVTMVVGAVAAVSQMNVRRLVTSIGLTHTGFVLVGVQSANGTGEAAALFALVAWGGANAGAFALMAAMSRTGHRHEDVRDFTGLGYERPVVALLLTVCLLSLAGVPPTAGFAGRWLLLSAAVQDGMVPMAVLAALTSVVLTYACLRLVVQMYMVTSPVRRPRPDVSRRTVAGLAVIVAGLVALGVWPAPLFDAALRSVASVF